jgi:hypothetical protein
MKSGVAPEAGPGGGVHHNQFLAVDRLREASVGHLRVRVALPLEAPRDWTGPTRSNVAVATVANLACSYSHRIRSNGASQARRSHVEEEVRRAVCDLDLATERRGSPHTLIATKNQASYGRRAKQRRQDLENVAALTG